MDIAHLQKFNEIFFEKIHDGIILFDNNYRILAANKSVERWIERPISDLIDKDCRDIFHDIAAICPHCIAKVTFETGEVNTSMQKGVHKGETYYAELSAYPINDERGETIECVVLIRDVTDRMLCHDDILKLYNKVAHTKEYLEGIIENSADAIVTADLNGIITSWNKGAETIYGFSEHEVMGKYLPFIPDFLMDVEREYIERIKKGETIKHIETMRKTKVGTVFEVSITMSPIKATNGKIMGFSCISRDISMRKSIEKELINRNQELSRLLFISSTMRGSLELDRLLRMVLTAVTMGDGLGFNRAILFLIDEGKNVLKGAMGVGHTSHEEAFQIWNKLSVEKKTLPDIIQEIETEPSQKDSFFDRLSVGIEIPLTEETILTKAVKEKKSYNIQDVARESLSDVVLIQQLGTQAYAVVPLISRDKVIGVIWVDNLFTRRLIVDEDMRFLSAFSNHVATAIESARLFERVSLAEQELENIFESISDMVYFVTEDYVVKSINKAVINRLGKPQEEIIGKKCYEVFHGLNEPWAECPHRKTMEGKKAFVREIQDPYLGGTSIISSSPILDTSGKSIGTVNVVSDITELKNLRERLIMTERLAALGEVAARVAHEIRNPLVSLGGFAKRLEKKLDGNLKEYADIIAKEVERLEGILSEILGFVKETRIIKEMVNSNKLIDDITSLINSEIDEKGILLEKTFAEPVDLYIDPNRIKEALLNVLTNAVQAVGRNDTISVKTLVKDNSFVVEIKDNGRGIAEEDLPFIFDPFFTTKKTGTGLGLTITHRIIEEHKGSIEVQSKPNTGTTFRVFIPLNKEEKNK